MRKVFCSLVAFIRYLYHLSSSSSIINYYFIPANLDSILKSANELLKEWRASKSPKQNWGQRTAILNENWESVRALLMNAVVSGYAVDETRCMKCLEHIAEVSCYDCHTYTRLCGHCDQLVHKMQPFHDRDGSTSDFFKPIPPTVSLDSNGKWVLVVKYSISYSIILNDMYYKMLFFTCILKHCCNYILFFAYKLQYSYIGFAVGIAASFEFH